MRRERKAASAPSWRSRALRPAVITGRPVHTNAIEREPTMLTRALNWARGYTMAGIPCCGTAPT
jgi:hypothetical protein